MAVSAIRLRQMLYFNRTVEFLAQNIPYRTLIETLLPSIYDNVSRCPEWIMVNPSLNSNQKHTPNDIIRFWSLEYAVTPF